MNNVKILPFESNFAFGRIIDINFDAAWTPFVHDLFKLIQLNLFSSCKLKNWLFYNVLMNWINFSYKILLVTFFIDWSLNMLWQKYVTDYNNCCY